MTDDEKKAHIVQLVEVGAVEEGTTLTNEQCQLLLEYISDQFNDGYAYGGNNSVSY